VVWEGETGISRAIEGDINISTWTARCSEFFTIASDWSAVVFDSLSYQLHWEVIYHSHIDHEILASTKPETRENNKDGLGG
jgi:hypothetical protein